MQLGLMLPIIEGGLGDGRTARWADLRDMARLAEDVGVDTVWIADHLLFRRHEPNMLLEPGETRGPWECFTMLTAIAAVTNRVTLGPFVACTGYRNPAHLAKIADALDEVSGGRLLLGLGAGWHEPEYRAFGYPFDHLVGRFEEALAIILPLLKDGAVDFQGQYYEARDCELRPRGPRQQGPPIWIGAQRPRMLRNVAKYADAYNTDFRLTQQEVGDLVRDAKAACAEVGRDPSTLRQTAAIRIWVQTGDEIEGDEVKLVRKTLGGVERAMLAGTAEAIARYVLDLGKFGVDHVTCYSVLPSDIRGVERFAAVVEAVKKGG